MDVDELEATRVFQWRYDQLREAGISRLDARRIAETDRDVHALARMLADLIEQGCDRDLALRIVL